VGKKHNPSARYLWSGRCCLGVLACVIPATLFGRSANVPGVSHVQLADSQAASVAAPTQEVEPSPAEDVLLLVKFRGDFLQELGLTNEYEQYMMADDAKRKPLFAQAVSRLQLAWMGIPIQGQEKALVSKEGFLKRLANVFRLLLPGDLSAVADAYVAMSRGGGTSFDPEALARGAKLSEAAARVFIGEFVSPEKAAMYNDAPMLAQADMLLETAAAIINSRSWPTAHFVALSDTLAGRVYLAARGER